MLYRSIVTVHLPIFFSKSFSLIQSVDDDKIMDDQNLESNRSQQKRRIDEISPQQDCAQMALDTKRKSPKLFPDVTEWLTSFENMPETLQLEALSSLIPLCKQSQIRHLHNTIAPYFQVDFLRLLPRELSMKILGHLPLKDLVVAASISRAWNILAEDNRLWVKFPRTLNLVIRVRNQQGKLKTTHFDYSPNTDTVDGIAHELVTAELIDGHDLVVVAANLQKLINMAAATAAQNWLKPQQQQGRAERRTITFALNSGVATNEIPDERSLTGFAQLSLVE